MIQMVIFIILKLKLKKLIFKVQINKLKKGIHRPSIEKLAVKRVPINFYDGPLSKGGYKILISDKDVALPSGEIVASGINFRNTYHLR